MNTEHQILVTFTGAVVFGVLFTLIAYKLEVSSIVILMLGGIIVGPQGLHLIHPESLGDGLQTIISIAVGLILFEGGLTLDIKGYKMVSYEIKSVLTKGVLVTWLASSLAVRLIFAFKWDLCLLAGSLIIVTGPTVIGPLLKRIRVRRRIQNILHWEGVLIDPIGVFIALLCYEWMVNPGDQPTLEFLKRAVVGVLFGFSSGVVISFVVKRRWIPDDCINISFLAAALATFEISDIVASESGLLSVTISGFVIGYLRKQQIERVKIYKAELIQLLIGLLFVLLSANLDLSAFASYGFRGVLLVAIVMFVVRPMNIFVSTHRSKLPVSEKLFLSWIAPRGIVAASMASLFSLSLQEQGIEHADFLETFTYSVIVGTVLFQGFSANAVGRFLGVLEPRPQGWIIVGAHRLGRRIAAFIKSHQKHVVVVDTNIRNISQARRDGFIAINDNATTLTTESHPDLYGIGNILAVTENEDLNTLICQRWKKESPDANLYRWGIRKNSAEDDFDDHLMAGKLIWNQLLISQMNALSTDDEDRSFITLTADVKDVVHPERVLLCAYNGQIEPGLPENRHEKCEILTFRPISVKLDLLIKPEWIILSEASSLKDVTREMLEAVYRDYSDLDIENLYQRLVDYEHKYSSLICPGTALPHAYSDGLRKSLVVVAKLKRPIESIHSDENIEIVFLVLSPTGQPKRHLKTLSEISRFMMDDDNRDRLLTASTLDDVRRLFFQWQPTALN